MGIYDNLNHLSGIEFEKFCCIILENMGFSVTETKTSGDGGIDLIAQNYQPLLSGKYIIQCKRYTGSVGEPIIRDLFGVVMSERANKGILMTTGYFTKQAISFAEGKPLELIDGDKLNELIGLYLNDVFVSNNSNAMSDPQAIKYDSCFAPLIPKHQYTLLKLDTYLQLVYNLAYDSKSLKNIGDMVSFLQEYVLGTRRDEFSNGVTDDEFNKSKFNAIIKTILVAENIQSIHFLYPEYLSLMAQNYFLSGLWNISLGYYEKMLRLPGVLFDVDYSRSYYTGELETAARIIHNICVIYVCMNETAKAKDTMKQYKYIFDLEFQRTLRLMRNNPQLQNNFEEESERLNDVFDKIWFYFDLQLRSPIVYTGSLLDAILSDCQRENTSCKIELDDIYKFRVVKKDYSAIKLMSVSDGISALSIKPSEDEILEISYHPNKSVEFYDVNQ